MSPSTASRVLITGKGYIVIGTARTAAKAEFLKKQFAEYGDRFQIVEIKDMQQPGAFNELVKNVDVIQHIASPFHYKANDPIKELMNPAVQGTMNVLNAAYEHGNNVKHVVVTSSVAAVAWPTAPSGYVFTEKDWNEATVTEVLKWKPGEEFSKDNAYRASKNAAERAVWNFRDEKKPNFRLTVINPEDINTSVAMLFGFFTGEQQDVPAPLYNMGFVDVRDTAKAHVRAIELGPKADGERLITVSGTYTWQRVVDILHKRFPEYSNRIPLGDPGKNYETLCQTSGKKAANLLGIDYIGLEQMTVDTINSLKQFW
ncbi:hypothetical protein BZG36_01840 [Bifiguratus adelaidae]|uniref:Thioester reductase (TE) domain-containing protein n=1 Tax=Bifiguratus adelaidae TaxID=1938954 RepID=A0A261Y2G5_9FUNG|nr:hypothetical protein BZG36_01840 [Bifiguratus adelaidae]